MEERSIDDLEAPLTFCLHLNPNIVISRTIWIRHFIRTKYGPKLNQENQAKHLVNMDQYSISTKTQYRPKLMDQNFISTKTPYRPKLIMDQNSWTKTQYRPKFNIDQNSSWTKTHHGPKLTIDQNSISTKTHYGPKLNIDQNSLWTKTHYGPKLIMDQNSSWTKTRQIKRRESSETFSLVELCNFGTLRP
jgi:hypothetical protein